LLVVGVTPPPAVEAASPVVARRVVRRRIRRRVVLTLPARPLLVTFCPAIALLLQAPILGALSQLARMLPYNRCLWAISTFARRPADPMADDPPPDRRDPAVQHVQPGGRREWTLTLREVAQILRTDVRKVKLLIREGHLRAIRISPKVVRITERALGEFLHPVSNKIDRDPPGS
jgi:excisionase family DNA binding protein